jgi:hypothetical protein
MEAGGPRLAQSALVGPPSAKLCPQIACGPAPAATPASTHRRLEDDPFTGKSRMNARLKSARAPCELSVLAGVGLAACALGSR